MRLVLFRETPVGPWEVKNTQMFSQKNPFVLAFDSEIHRERKLMQTSLEKPFLGGGPQHSGSSFVIYVEVKITGGFCAVPSLICWAQFAALSCDPI